MQTTIPPGLDLGASPPHAPGSREYIVVESGTLLLTIDGTPYTLHAGDSIYYEADCTHAFANPGAEPCRYYLVVAVPAERVHRNGRTR
jgi:quercetin dioxygenase-like cupin family protein